MVGTEYLRVNATASFKDVDLADFHASYEHVSIEVKMQPL